jgi:hypothetical protein
MRSRRAIAAAVLAGWAVAIGWHVRREYFRPSAERLALGARALAPGTHFFTITMNGAAIGIATARLDTAGGGFILDDNLVLDVPALNTVARAVANTHVELDDSLALRGFDFRLESAVGKFIASGERNESGGLNVSLDGGGSASHIEIAGGTLLDAAVPLRLAAAGALEAGRETTVSVFDPSTLSTRSVTVRITATDTLILPDSVGLGADGRFVATGMDTIPVWRLEQEFGGLRIATWVDEDGMTVRAESPLGFTIERTAYELAQQSWNDARANPTLAEGYGVLIESTAVASNVAIDDIATLVQLRVRLLGVELAGFDLDGDRQSLRADTLTITRTPVPVSAGYTLPWQSGGNAAAELAATPLIQSDDARIRRAAQEATRGSTDPAVAATRLNTWVHAYLRKAITPSIPSALQVLEAKQGDCNEHTVLYVALARSLGLPARTAVGLVHIRGRFYYHAWPEVWLNGNWIAMDPTLGQVPADAGHIRFLVGGLARQVELLRLVGRLGIERIGD